VIAVIQLGDQNSHRKCSLFAQGARQQAGLVVELARGLADAFPRFVRNGTTGHVIQDDRNGGGAQSEIIRKDLQARPALTIGRFWFVFGHSSIRPETARCRLVTIEFRHESIPKAVIGGDKDRRAESKVGRRCSMARLDQIALDYEIKPADYPQTNDCLNSIRKISA
jgi:hypothetical protein